MTDLPMNDLPLSAAALLERAETIYTTLEDHEAVPDLYDRLQQLFFAEPDPEVSLLLSQSANYLAYSLYRLGRSEEALNCCVIAFQSAQNAKEQNATIRSLLLKAVIASFCALRQTAHDALDLAGYLLSLENGDPRKEQEHRILIFEYLIVSMRLALLENDLSEAEEYRQKSESLMNSSMTEAGQNTSDSFAASVSSFPNSDRGEFEYACGLLDMKLNQAERAQEHLKSAIDLFEDDAPVQQVNAYNQLSLLYKKQNRLSEAFSAASSAWSIRRHFYGDENLLTSISYGNLLQCAGALLDHGYSCPLSREEWLDGLKANAKMRKKLCSHQDEAWYGRALLDLSQALLNEKQLESARKALVEADHVFSKLNDSYYLLYVLEKQIALEQMATPLSAETNKNLACVRSRFEAITKDPAFASHPAVRRYNSGR